MLIAHTHTCLGNTLTKKCSSNIETNFGSAAPMQNRLKSIHVNITMTRLVKCYCYTSLEKVVSVLCNDVARYTRAQRNTQLLHMQNQN